MAFSENKIYDKFWLFEINPKLNRIVTTTNNKRFYDQY